MFTNHHDNDDHDDNIKISCGHCYWQSSSSITSD